MTELVQCTRCRNMMIEEEYDDHLCRPRIRSYKVMKFTEFHIMKGEDGRTILNIVTSDGDDLMLEEIPENKEHTKIPYELPDQARTDGFTHRELPDGDSPEPMKDGFKYYASFLLVR